LKKEIVLGDFKPKKRGLKKVFGDLEANILEKVWEKEPVTVREVFKDISEERKLAYTTVMTILTRLANKGILKQTKKGNAYVYTSIWKRDELIEHVVGEVLEGLFEDFGDFTREKVLEKLD